MAPPVNLQVITQRDIAARCGISKVAVSLALRDDASISTATKARVREVARELGYNPAHNYTASRLAYRRHGLQMASQVIGLFIGQDVAGETFYTLLMQGLLRTLVPAGYGLLVGSFSNPTDNRAVPLDITQPSLPRITPEPLVCRGDLDALILYCGPPHVSELVRQLRANPGFGERPIVSLLFPAPGAQAVLADERQGAFAAVTHLLQLGHRHFLLLSHLRQPLTDPLLVGRVSGMRSALSAFGLTPEEHLHALSVSVEWIYPNHRDEERPLPPGETNFCPAAALRSFLADHPQVTAILAQNDACALHAWQTLAASGKRVPDDISIIGYDDTDPIRGENGDNLLTTVRMPLQEVGQESARLLLEQFHPDTLTTPHRPLATELIVRASTAPAP